jgi:hypothetical protein
MDKRATVTAIDLDDECRVLPQQVNAQPGKYALYPVGERVYTLEEIRSAFGEWYGARELFHDPVAGFFYILASPEDVGEPGYVDNANAADPTVPVPPERPMPIPPVRRWYHEDTGRVCDMEECPGPRWFEAYVPPAHPSTVEVGDVWQWKDDFPRTVGRVDGDCVILSGYGANTCKNMLDPASGWRLVSRAGKPRASTPPERTCNEEFLAYAQEVREQLWELASHCTVDVREEVREVDLILTGAQDKVDGVIGPGGKPRAEGPEPTSPLPEVGSWWWCSFCGLAKVTSALKGVIVLTSKAQPVIYAAQRDFSGAWEPASPLPAVGDFFYHPEKGLLKVLPRAVWTDWVMLGNGDGRCQHRMHRSDWPGSWEGPLVTCGCGKGCFYFRAGCWRDRDDEPVLLHLEGMIFTPCNRVLGVDAQGQPTVSGVMVESHQLLAEVCRWLRAYSGLRSVEHFEKWWMESKHDALAAGPLGEEGGH